MAVSALHAVDLDDAQLETYLVAVLRNGDPASRMLGEQRARALLAAVYAGIREACEDLEPLVADMHREAHRLAVAAQHSAGRRAALEHRLGIERAVRGEVVP